MEDSRDRFRVVADEAISEAAADASSAVNPAVAGPVAADSPGFSAPQATANRSAWTSDESAGAIDDSPAASGPHDEQPDVLPFSMAAETREAEQAAARMIDAILRSAHVLRGLLSDHYAEFGLSDVRFTVLQKIANSSPQGCSQAELAQYLQQSESSISTLIDRMRGDDLLYRLPSQTDRRKKVLVLTDRGRDRLQAVADCHARRMRQLLERAGCGSEVGELSSVLDGLATQLVDLANSGQWLFGTAGRPDFEAAEQRRRSA